MNWNSFTLGVRGERELEYSPFFPFWEVRWKYESITRDLPSFLFERVSRGRRRGEAVVYALAKNAKASFSAGSRGTKRELIHLYLTFFALLSSSSYQLHR